MLDRITLRNFGPLTELDWQHLGPINLVIGDDWLPPIRDALNSSLKPLVSTWRLAPTAVMVFNESLARQYDSIRTPASASSV